jgi:hypothetical protein
MGKTYRRNSDSFNRRKKNVKIDKSKDSSKTGKFNKNRPYEVTEEE